MAKSRHQKPGCLVDPSGSVKVLCLFTPTGRMGVAGDGDDEDDDGTMRRAGRGSPWNRLGNGRSGLSLVNRELDPVRGLALREHRGKPESVRQFK